MNQALVRDCVVKVTWTGDADVDVLVEEPSGTICSLRNLRTTAGGVMLGDSFSQLGDAKSPDGYSEMYVCPEGFGGKYRILLRRVWGDVTAGKVTVDIYTNYRSKKQGHLHRQIPLAEKDAVVIFDVPSGRRTESLAAHQLANVARAQTAVSRAILAQLLNTVTDSSAVRDFAVDRRYAQKAGLLGPNRRRNVGFQPVITTLPSGANISATAVISADRRYVRITPTPLFSSIGQINTFNFGGGDGGVEGGEGGDGGEVAQ